MSAGAITLVCLLAAAQPPGQPPAKAPEVHYFSTPRFSIPIKVKPEDRPAIRELRLWCSEDLGRTWNVVASATPEQPAFSFTARKDGPYWFTVAVVDTRDQQDPVDVKMAPVGQRVVVDTARPEVRLKAERRGEEVVASWECTEDYPVPETLKLEYRLADMPAGQWYPVGLQPGPTGEASFKPPSGAAVTLRMSLEDRARNVGVGTAELAAGGITRAGATTADSTQTQPRLAADLPPHLAGQFAAQPAKPPEQPTPVEKQPLPPPEPQKQLLSSAPTGQSQDAHHVVAQGQGAAGGAGPEGQPTGQPAVPGSLPTVQYVPSQQVKLEFEVSVYGPSGPGGVDVYLTPDDGKTWELQRIDPTAVSVQVPPAEGKGEPLRGSVVINLPQPGVPYGYTLVVKNRANRGKAPPRPGDLPEVRLELDVTPPRVELYVGGAVPGSVRRDCLPLTWTVQDKNPSAAPVKLEWAARQGGPWQPVGPRDTGGLVPNTGSYAWQVPADVPPKAYLRLTVRDLAGNETVAQTPSPVDVDLIEPVTHIVGVNPAGPR
jgi:hypothetical protein